MIIGQYHKDIIYTCKMMIVFSFLRQSQIERHWIRIAHGLNSTLAKIRFYPLLKRLHRGISLFTDLNEWRLFQSMQNVLVLLFVDVICIIRYRTMSQIIQNVPVPILNALSRLNQPLNICQTKSYMLIENIFVMHLVNVVSPLRTARTRPHDSLMHVTWEDDE